jgi:dTDP-4-amino-4,6-dideoxygalactose transaminase
LASLSLVYGKNTTTEPLRFMKPTLPSLEDVVSLYKDVYHSGVITNAKLVSRLEDAVADRLRVKHCVAVSSCTSGLALVMKAYGLKGEVILPSFTFFASGEAVLWNGLKPVFADCRPDTWNIDPVDVIKRITPSTAAILGVHMYGNPADVESLEDIAARSKIKLIFDAAHAFGSSYRGMPIGGFGDAEVFSLSPTKLLVAGEGGLVTTNDSALAYRLKAARNYGDLGNYDPILCGLNARMGEFNAALAFSGLDLVDQKVARHNEIAARYTRLLSGRNGITFQKVPAESTSTYKDFSFHVNPTITGWTSESLGAALEPRGVPTKRYFYPPLHQQKIFSEFHTSTDRDLRITERVSSGVVSLPIYASLSNDEVDMIVDAVDTLLAHPIQ